MSSPEPNAEGSLDLELVRTVPVPRELIWKAWTEPKHLMKWFCPRPWQTVACEIDLRPGGKFYTSMQGPAGEGHAGEGCFLEVEAPGRLVWTTALQGGYRPVTETFMPFTAFLTFEDVPGGTRYTARVIHKDAADAQKHAEMGFTHGWSAALDQLVEIADQLKD